jgi:acyl-CoA thioester hydrolase
LGEAHLLVEMLMQDESRQSVKAVLWSKFTCVNLKTGKKENHADDFMEFARQVVLDTVDVSEGIRGRLSSLYAGEK